MTDTWMVRTQWTNPDFSRPVLSEGLLGISNKSDQVVEIQEIWIDSPSGNQSQFSLGVLQGGVGNYNLQRISAFSGGEALSPVKHDTGSAALPAQVSLKRWPDTITITGEKIRVLPDTPGNDVGVNLIQMGAGRPGEPLGSGASANGDLFHTRRRGSLQPIILRGGEGVGLWQDTQSGAHLQWACVTLRNAGSGATYQVFTDALLTRGPEEPLLAIFNGLGSGIVLEIIDIILLDIGQNSTSFIPSVRLLYLPPALWDGANLSAISMDTGNSGLPAGIVIKKGFTVSLSARGGGHDFPLTTAEDLAIPSSYGYHRINLSRGAVVNPYNLLQMISCGKTILYQARSGYGIKLRSHEGFGIAYGYGAAYVQAFVNGFYISTFANYDIGMLFTVGAAAATGGISRSRAIAGIG